MVTNGPPSQLLKIDATNLAGEFDAICVSSIVGSRKPERRIFEEAAKICEVPLNGWMVGDSPNADVGSTLARPDAEVDTIDEAVSRILDHQDE